MKPFICIGAALMATAGIYGFVDYKKTNQEVPLKSIYNVEEKKLNASEAPLTTGLTVKTEVASAVLPDLKNEKNITRHDEQVIAEKKKKRKKKKDINYELFSRAPLEPYKEVTVADPVKQKQ